MSKLEIAIVVIVVVVSLCLLEMIIGAFRGWYSVKHAPREPMFLCKVHGPIRRENMITFSDYEAIYTDIDGKVKDVRGDFDYCTLCLHSRLTAAEKIPTL